MKTVWITGGGSGIGKALALLMLAHGYKVYISGRTLEKLQQVGAGTLPVVCDITKPDEVKDALDQIGHVDIAVLNAGGYEPGAVKETSLDSFRKIMEINYFGAVTCVMALLERQVKHIAVVGSVAGYRGLPNAAGYGPSKAALISFVESLRTELHGTDTKVQLVSPGFVKSPLTDQNDFDMPYIIEPEEAADEIYKGLQTDQFEIAFPKPFVRRLKFVRLLPYKYYFPLIKKVTGS
ncbi:SDR family NAD(P)-dependent oxidoreductase [Terasakiella pusilla]|uniref:SDR family NAD(P)-dependent oxidoreductase n=1 Tax=Terasakiella pusilla TaxID=64973 RepID=UPI000570956A|nr:SDR family NAD(P)-dependent oxidoreductase [Terasakiella pusilla]